MRQNKVIWLIWDNDSEKFYDDVYFTLKEAKETMKVQSWTYHTPIKFVRASSFFQDRNTRSELELEYYKGMKAGQLNRRIPKELINER